MKELLKETVNIQKILLAVCVVALVALMLGTSPTQVTVAESAVVLDAGTEGGVVLGILVYGVYRLRKSGKP